MNKHNNIGQAIKMKRRAPYQTTQQWLGTKYGKDVSPWEVEINVQPFKDDNENEVQYPIKIEYRYEKLNNNGDHQKEKIENRVMEIQKPETYGSGVLSKDGQVNTNKVWIVNGCISKVDGNFIQKKFNVSKVGETGLMFGQYPANE